MGTKKMILFLYIILSLNVLDTYGQNGYEEKIKWFLKDSFITFVYADTCQLKDELWFSCYTQKMTIDNSCYFFKFVQYGSGEPHWFIGIYKQEYDLWREVAEGYVTRPVASITAEIDLTKSTIVFYTLIPELDPNTSKIKHLKKMEEIGELSFDDL